MAKVAECTKALGEATKHAEEIAKAFELNSAELHRALYTAEDAGDQVVMPAVGAPVNPFHHDDEVMAQTSMVLKKWSSTPNLRWVKGAVEIAENDKKRQVALLHVAGRIHSNRFGKGHICELCCLRAAEETNSEITEMTEKQVCHTDMTTCPLRGTEEGVELQRYYKRVRDEYDEEKMRNRRARGGR
jgi:hypothetical protein